MLHPLVHWLSRRCLGWFYRKIHVVGADRIPCSGPVILMMNHGNDVPDVLVGFKASPRDVRYVATMSAAASKVVQWTYRGLGVVPVSRIRDVRKLKARGIDVAALNAAAFVRVISALRGNQVVGIFPEGGVSNTPHFGQFQPGMARMALEACDDGAIRSIQLVPLGIQYENPECTRSDLVAVVGKPIELDNWQPHGHGNRYKALTREAAQRLASVTRNAPTLELLHRRNRLLAALGAAERTEGEPPIVSAERVRRVFDRGGDGAASSQEDDWTQQTESRRALEAAADALSRWVERAGGRGQSARDHADVGSAAGAFPASRADVRAARAIWLAPFAATGWAVHALPFALLLFLADRLAIGPSERAARAILPGLYVILAWYVLLAIALVAVGGWAWLVLIAVLPRLGDAAVTWRDDLAAWRIRRRVRQWTSAERATVCSHFAELREGWRDYFQVLGDRHERSHTNSSVVSVSAVSHTAAPSA